MKMRFEGGKFEKYANFGIMSARRAHLDLGKDLEGSGRVQRKRCRDARDAERCARDSSSPSRDSSRASPTPHDAINIGVGCELGAKMK